MEKKINVLWFTSPLSEQEKNFLSTSERGREVLNLRQECEQKMLIIEIVLTGVALIAAFLFSFVGTWVVQPYFKVPEIIPVILTLIAVGFCFLLVKYVAKRNPVLKQKAEAFEEIRKQNQMYQIAGILNRLAKVDTIFAK